MFHFLVRSTLSNNEMRFKYPQILTPISGNPFSRGWIHVKPANLYEAPDFHAGFMIDKRDMAPMVSGYIKSRETARRMAAYAGEVTGMHPHFAHNSPARAYDMDLGTTKAYAGPNHLNAGIQHGT